MDPETRRRYLEQMSVHIRSLSALIEDLFELSRLEAGDIQWSCSRFDWTSCSRRPWTP